jgi:hypothetical protein
MAISETDAIPLAIEIILPGGTYREQGIILCWRDGDTGE